MLSNWISLKEKSSEQQKSQNCYVKQRFVICEHIVSLGLVEDPYKYNNDNQL